MRRRTSSDVPSYTACSRRAVSLAASGGRVAEKSRDRVANEQYNHDVSVTLIIASRLLPPQMKHFYPARCSTKESLLVFMPLVCLSLIC